MKQFIAMMSKEKTSDVDPALFDRTKEPPIADYIVSGLKVIESLSPIKFVRWEHITDASQFEVRLNRRHLKNKTISKDKEITKLVNIRETAEEMLRMEFLVDYDGESRYIRKNLLIPAYVDNYHMHINGKDVLPQKQIVDMSTYNQKKSVKLKTTLTPIDIYKDPVKAEFVSTDDDRFSVKTFILNLFTKEINPLYYYLAKFGFTKTVNYFGLYNIVDIADEEYNMEINYYFRINKEILVEVDKRYFNESEFVRCFTYMVYNIFNVSKARFENIDSIDFWTVKLGAIFTTNTKNQLNKGKNVLISFGRILDDITKSALRLDDKHLQSTHSLVRWMIQNYSELRKKDNHDLTLKRVRCNEVTAFYFIQAMSVRINNLLNSKKMSIESIERIFNWNPGELFKIMLSSKNTLLKYDPDINCFDLLNALRFSFLGNQGISGGKNIGDQFRDIYASHLGRIDLNGISHGKNTALTGFLVPRCKIYGNGFFSEKTKDPDIFNGYMHSLKQRFSDKLIDASKSLIRGIKDRKYEEICKLLKPHTYEMVDGLIVLHRRLRLLKHLDTGEHIISATVHKPLGYRQSYRNQDGKLLTPDDRFIIQRRNKPIQLADGAYLIKSGMKKLPAESMDEIEVKVEEVLNNN